MNEIQLQEKQLYNNLNPLFKEYGYEQEPFKKQYKLTTPTGFRSVAILMNGNRTEQTIDLMLGIRVDLVEDLVNQFMEGIAGHGKDSTTITASYGRLIRQPYKRFVVKNEEEIAAVCERIDYFMRSKGFRFLEGFDSLRKLDKIINRKPQEACPFLFNQVSRCFKGITIAKMTHRTDFSKLSAIYLNHLNNQWASSGAIHNYEMLVNYLQYFSMN